MRFHLGLKLRQPRHLAQCPVLCSFGQKRKCQVQHPDIPGYHQTLRFLIVTGGGSSKASLFLLSETCAAHAWRSTYIPFAAWPPKMTCCTCHEDCAEDFMINCLEHVARLESSLHKVAHALIIVKIVPVKKTYSKYAFRSFDARELAFMLQQNAQ